MNKSLRVILSFTLFGFSFHAHAADQKPIEVEFIDRPEDVPARTLRVTIDGVGPGDVTELEVMAADNKWAEPYRLTTLSDNFRFRVSPGKYFMRTHRAKTTLPWGPPTEFVVPFKEPKRVFPDGDEIEPKGNLSEKLRFEWFPDQKAVAYRVKIYNKGNLVRHVVTKQSWLSATLDTGQRYRWTLHKMASLDEPDTDKDSKSYWFTINKPHRELFQTEIDVERKLHAENYQFELVSIRDDETTSDPTIYESKDPIFRAELAPAEYELRVRTFFSNGEFSQWSAPKQFFVRLPKPKLTYPVENMQIISDDEQAANAFLQWKKVEGANRYRVIVKNSKGEEVYVTEVPKNEAKIKVPHDDTYYWTAAPLLKRETDRSPASEAPPASFRMTKYVRLKLGPEEEPSQFYSWGRGIYANTVYRADNYDSHSFINQPIYATTGELALGYWHRLSSLGILLTGGMTGIDVAGQKNLSYNYSASMGYRWKLRGTTRARAWLGYSNRETPEVVVDGLLKTFSIKTIANSGPQLLGTYADALSDKWGYQLFGGMYYGLIPTVTPNGRPQSKYFTYYASAYLTRRWSPLITGLLGYTYQIDEAGYKSDDRTGKDNHVRYAGHYISLALIFGLQEPKK